MTLRTRISRLFLAVSLAFCLFTPAVSEAADPYTVIYDDVSAYNGNPVECDWIANAILYASSLYGVDPYLITAVMQTESHFYLNAMSPVGAIGLMQLMPDTAEWIAGQLEDPAYSVEAIHEPERNIRYGIWYLSSLQREFGGNDVLALAAYNAGRGNVQEWIRDNGWPADFHDIDAIPYQETREYVRKVLLTEHKYRSLYPTADGTGSNMKD